MAKSSPIMVDIGQGLSLMVGLPVISSWTTDNRPKNPKRGIFGFNSEANQIEIYDGENWYAGSLNQI